MFILYSAGVYLKSLVLHSVSLKTQWQVYLHDHLPLDFQRKYSLNVPNVQVMTINWNFIRDLQNY